MELLADFYCSFQDQALAGMSVVTNFMDNLEGEAAAQAGANCMQVAGKATKKLTGEKVTLISRYNNKFKIYIE